jgi:hypothetical protein
MIGSAINFANSCKRLDRWNKCGLLINCTSKGSDIACHSARDWRGRIAGEARFALWQCDVVVGQNAREAGS